jgi:hypothetical protein
MSAPSTPRIPAKAGARAFSKALVERKVSQTNLGPRLRGDERDIMEISSGF